MDSVPRSSSEQPHDEPHQGEKDEEKDHELHSADTEHGHTLGRAGLSVVDETQMVERRGVTGT